MEPRTEVVPLIGKEEIRAAIVRLAERLCEYYSGKTVVVIGLLTGAYAFVTHLTEAMEEWNARQPIHRRVRILIDFLNAASYQPAAGGVGMKSRGQVRIYGDIKVSIRGRHVIVADDVGDTLQTLRQITAFLATRRPRSLRVVCMLKKRGSAKVRLRVPLEVAMQIPRCYVVGVGLDNCYRHRSLPWIGAVVRRRVPR